MERKDKAFLIAGYKENKSECEEHLHELSLLADTYGMETVGQMPCLLRKITAATFLTKGKLEEAIEYVRESGANIVVFDNEISPSQQRNLEKAFGITVMDRTEVILGVFAAHAHSKEAHLQVELAQTKYQVPRLKRLWTHLGRQSGTAGAGAYLKGAGEKQIEIDKRLLSKRISHLEREIKEIRAHRITQRKQRVRSGIPTFALIGYTNVGKSTLLNALTDADVLVEDKLFATLDTTTRKFILPNHQEILFIDTVGFIRKLPHLLVASFKSTLEEALEADILLHIVDASDPAACEHVKATFEVLEELGTTDKPIISIFNKIDQNEDPGLLKRLRVLCVNSVMISAKEKTGFDELIERITQELEKTRKHVKLKLPQSEYAVVSDVNKRGHVIETEYVDNDVIVTADLPYELAEKYKKYQI
ncbi:MAG: GTPase HflX [Waddliaceae bacterium]